MKQELMIIDDDEASRFLLRERIARLGYTYEVYETINGQEAIEFLLDYESKLTTEGVKEQVCLLIFLDINMPIMNGFEFLDKFHEMSKQLKIIKPTIIYMLSSSENPADLEKIKKNDNVKQFVLKYPDDKMLRDILEDAFVAAA